jgi:hypothetical protein
VTNGRIVFLRTTLTLVGTCALLTGCAAAHHSPTLAEAKEKVLSQEHAILSLVASDIADEPFINETSPLMPCKGQQKLWSGTAQATLTVESDDDDVLDRVRDGVRAASKARVEDRTDTYGDRMVDILHADGTHIMVSIWGNPRALQVDSFSACFDLPDYQYPKEY